MNKTGVVKVGKYAATVIKTLRRTRGLRYIDGLDAMARGWDMLTPEQQTAAIEIPERKISSRRAPQTA